MLLNMLIFQKVIPNWVNVSVKIPGGDNKLGSSIQLSEIPDKLKSGCVIGLAIPCFQNGKDKLGCPLVTPDMLNNIYLRLSTNIDGKRIEDILATCYAVDKSSGPGAYGSLTLLDPISTESEICFGKGFPVLEEDHTLMLKFVYFTKEQLDSLSALCGTGTNRSLF